MILDIDYERLQAFEDQLDPADPEHGPIPARVLGYGEISAVLQVSGMEHLALKRLPPFESPEQRADYREAIDAYCELLSQQKGVHVLNYRCIELTNRDREHILYIAQPVLPADTVGNRFARHCTEPEFAEFMEQFLTGLQAVWLHDEAPSAGLHLGLDAQISNWAFLPVHDSHERRLYYFDITTPFIRQNGRERMNPEVFLKSVPFFLVGLVRWAFLQEVLDRYYDMRSVLVDFLANFHKERLLHRMAAALELINAFLQQRDLAPITQHEIDKYYREDAFIWRIFLACRRLDRFLKTRLFRKKYQFILPGTIER